MPRLVHSLLVQTDFRLFAGVMLVVVISPSRRVWRYLVDSANWMGNCSSLVDVASPAPCKGITTTMICNPWMLGKPV